MLCRGVGCAEQLFIPLCLQREEDAAPEIQAESDMRLPGVARLCRERGFLSRAFSRSGIAVPETDNAGCGQQMK